MALNHIKVTESTNLARQLRALVSSLKEAREKLKYIRSVMDNMNDAVNYAEIEEQFGIESNGQTDTDSNGYKVLSYVGVLDDAFASNVAVEAQAQAAAFLKDKLDQITLHLA